MKGHSGSLLINEIRIKNWNKMPFSPIRQVAVKKYEDPLWWTEWGNDGGKLHTPSLAAESAQPQGEYLGKSIKAANEHTPFKPAAPLKTFVLQIYSHTCAPQCMFKVTHRGKTRRNKIIISRGLVPWIMAHPHHRFHETLKRRRQPFMDQ